MSELPTTVIANVPEHRELIEWAKHHKDSEAQNAPAGWPGDIEPRAAWYRDGQRVAFGIADKVDRDRGLQMACIGIQGFSADAIDFAVDAHMATQPFFEKFGRMPDPHELQNLCDNEGACDIGLTSDCIIVMHKERERTLYVTLPYHMHYENRPATKEEAEAADEDDKRYFAEEDGAWTHETKTVHWSDEIIVHDDKEGESKARIGGVIIDTLDRAFASPTLETLARDSAPEDVTAGMTPGQIRIHTDIAVIRVLSMAGFLIGVYGYDPDFQEALQRSMGRSGNFRMVDSQGDDVDLSQYQEDPNAADLVASMMGTALREKLRKDAEASYQEDQEEADRRRAERVEGQPTDEDRKRLANRFDQS